MYELMDGFISIVGGAYAYLAAIGKVQVSKSEEKSKEWRLKYGVILKVVGPLLVIFGLFRLYQSFLG
ncbi:MAG: thiosulfate reductase cytochrome b subunit [Neptuniibacter pectenicola]|jgi:hypothetical protein